PATPLLPDASSRARVCPGACRRGRRMRDRDLSRARGARTGRERTTDRRRARGSTSRNAHRLGARARERSRARRGLGAAGRHRHHTWRRGCRPRGDDAVGAARVKIDEGVELSNYTTLGTGGPARAFAAPESAEEVSELLEWAAARDMAVAVVGLGSN